MLRQMILGSLAVGLAVSLFAGMPSKAVAADPPLPRMYYYPYQYFPHSYWPQMSPQWPEPKGAPYVRPPAYMAYPPFKEPNWRYELGSRKNTIAGITFGWTSSK